MTDKPEYTDEDQRAQGDENSTFIDRRTDDDRRHSDAERQHGDAERRHNDTNMGRIEEHLKHIDEKLEPMRELCRDVAVHGTRITALEKNDDTLFGRQWALIIMVLTILLGLVSGLFTSRLNAVAAAVERMVGK